MPQYEQKSFEELRLEDYLAGNKGTKGQATPNTGFGGFGSPAPAPSAFGTQPAAAPTAFGAPAASTSLFGSSPGKHITLCQHDRIFNNLTNILSLKHPLVAASLVARLVRPVLCLNL